MGLADRAFWAGRRVLVTGHTGFKGAWLVLWLQALGARVTGLAAGPPTAPSLYELARVGDGIDEVAADVRDARAVAAAFAEHRPEVVLHLAAQPIVRAAFADPRTTYEVNVMGTVNVLEAVRATDSVRAVLAVTSDKAYDNHPGRAPRPFVEDDPKGGHDPYSSSKACAELVADAYRRSYFAPDPGGPRLASARAGNVIGGGDWGADRLVPDVVRAALAGRAVRVRNPAAVRPWQHVLDPLAGYLRLAEELQATPEAMGGWNFGPAAKDARPVGWVVERLAALWPGGLRVDAQPGPHPHEASLLALDSGKARERLGWAPAWGLDTALRSIVDFHVALRDGGDARALALGQIDAFSATAAPGQRASSSG